MTPRDEHECYKREEIARLTERAKNQDDLIKRFDNSLMSMSENMRSMAANMDVLARQGEQIANISRRQDETNKSIDILFSQNRETEEKFHSQHRELEEKLHSHELESGKESLEASKFLKNGALLAVIVACIGVVFKILFH